MTTTTTNPRSALRLVAIATTLALGAALALGGGSAKANYVVQECVGGVTHAPDAWATGSGNRKIWQAYECGQPPRPTYGLTLEANGFTQQSGWSGWYIYAAPGTTFKIAKASVHYGTGDGYGPVSDASGGIQGVGPTGGSIFETVERSNTTHLGILMWCFAGGGCQSVGGAPGPNAAYAYASNFYFEVQDLYAPSVGAAGELLDGSIARGIEGLQVSAGDTGGGVRSITVYVNDTPSRSSGDLCPPGVGGTYAYVKPCASSVSVPLALDTQKDPGWAVGPNDVKVCSIDVGGNGSVCLQRTVVVDNSCPASGGATAATNLNTGVEVSGQLRNAASVSSNTAPTVRGALKNGAGDPVAGATVCVYETVDLPDGSRQLAQIATTQGNGRFATRLDPGPSRDLDVVYRYNQQTLEKNLELNSRVVPTFKIADKSLVNGQAARFRGAVPGPNAEGRGVLLQAKAGKKWRTFKQLRTDSRGVFRGKYPFTQTTGRVRYTFRALVKRQGGYPYESGSSRKRKVLVTG